MCYVSCTKFTFLPNNNQCCTLGHPNVKLFITQGGLQSLDEAIHSKVPILTIPFFADQRYNSHHLSQLGAGLSIDFHGFTVDEFKEKITELITNSKYALNSCNVVI